MTTFSRFRLPRRSPTVPIAYERFMSSRKATLCTPKTLEYYERTVGEFSEWLEDQGTRSIAQVTVPQVQEFLNHVRARDVADSTVHAYARGCRAFLLWAHRNGYHPERLYIPMPRVAKKKLRTLTVGEVAKLLDGCISIRDRTLILLMVDTGLRRAELLGLDWGDVDLTTGAIQVRKGKGRKDRTVIAGNNTRELLEEYQATVDHRPADPVVQSIQGTRLKKSGLRQVCRRIIGRTGVYFTPHALRRTFATLSLQAGVNPIDLQNLMGHATLEQTRKYITLTEADLARAHHQYGPVDKWLGGVA